MGVQRYLTRSEDAILDLMDESDARPERVLKALEQAKSVGIVDPVLTATKALEEMSEAILEGRSYRSSEF